MPACDAPIGARRYASQVLRLRWLLVAVALVVAVGGCAFGEIFDSHGAPVDLNRADVVGTWCSGGQTRTITFADSGAFTAKNLPRALFEDPKYQAASQIDGAGTWRVASNEMDTNAPKSTVELDFTNVAGITVARAGPNLSALRQENDKVFLFFFYIDQGNSWTSYEKC